jgi:hypothetical protein
MRLLLLVILPLLLVGWTFAGGFTSLPKPRPTPLPTPQNTYKVEQPNGSTPAEQNLQLRTINVTKLLPPPPMPSSSPTTSCDSHGLKDSNCVCQPHPLVTDGVVCENATPTPSYGTLGGNPWSAPVSCPDHGIPCAAWLRGNPALYYSWQCSPNSCLYIKTAVTGLPDASNPVGYEKYKDQCGNHQICFAKPVIYLYPIVDTFVDVTLSIPGIITKSIPEYNNGWFDVLAHPDGRLEYQNTSYHELFYETEVPDAKPPKNGILFKKDEINLKLPEILRRLGLNQEESSEFMNYWMPEVLALKDDYIIFSIYEEAEKQRIDKIHISPKPDTRIEFLAYFKPVSFPVSVEPLILPEAPPARIGFTEVEWGGTIDLN